MLHEHWNDVPTLKHLAELRHGFGWQGFLSAQRSPVKPKSLNHLIRSKFKSVIKILPVTQWHLNVTPSADEHEPPLRQGFVLHGPTNKINFIEYLSIQNMKPTCSDCI